MSFVGAVDGSLAPLETQERRVMSILRGGPSHMVGNDARRLVVDLGDRQTSVPCTSIAS